MPPTASPPLTPTKPSSALRTAITASLAILLCNAVGIAGALLTSTDTDWYQTLTKPSFQPPGWVFGPVWTLLYTLMGVALFRVFVRRSAPGGSAALTLFGVQLLLNAIWSPLFFGAQAITAALVVIVLMVLAVVATMRSFWGIDRPAAWLLAPYLAWIGFATVLNGALLALN